MADASAFLYATSHDADFRDPLEPRTRTNRRQFVEPAKLTDAELLGLVPTHFANPLAHRIAGERPREGLTFRTTSEAYGHALPAPQRPAHGRRVGLSRTHTWAPQGNKRPGKAPARPPSEWHPYDPGSGIGVEPTGP
mmetsp:Transcript_12400/g.41990  ORF Transcript_12400/g.41990 Transcript_12400/m.41990 type:complete len:137 (+) Transcript_12400:27-437(+)|eukprot:CAMPEP_0206024454 /NCGR_PEP_ID=MMETSP1464-20131121/38201_1 /ASSEMBLY_ACC=CAM_ASM_001124 /TAXON_ID=119497 /ORGANISM="Exanthemachrysis gayraliae, Strain RCC1523" /LENGTH=136 /DNA_ID=CAMNT_0053398463 /DNA_START=9 /DNA_END=419 /DNA_ORIENTATION=-